MPATSKSQQRLMGWARACQTGRGSNCDRIGKLVDSIKPKDAADFARTKHEGLPERKKKKKKKPKTFKEFVQDRIDMKEYKKWKEAIDQVSPPQGVDFSKHQFGPTTRATAPVRMATTRFDKSVGNSLAEMNPKQKLHYLVDEIEGMVGSDVTGVDIQMLNKLKAIVNRIEGTLRNSN